MGDTVSILTNTYPHKPLRRIKWPCAVTRLTAHFTVANLSSSDFKDVKEYGYT